MFFNLSLLKAKLRGRKGIVVGAKSRIVRSSVIMNLGKSKDCIQIGKNCIIKGELFVSAHGGQITFGDCCYVGEGTRIWSGAKINVGNYVLISHGVSIMDNLTHPKNHLDRRAHYECIASVGHPADINLDDKPISIEDDAWIGAHAIILRGVNIGARSIVGAGAVVVNDVPEDCIVAGNPAKLVGKVDSEN